jgi:branched-chain amino acid aminotransferase
VAKAWVNGALLDDEEAAVSIRDHGLVVGDGAFETIVVHEGHAFAVTRHLERLARTAHGMGLPAPDQATLARAIEEVVAASGYTMAKLRVTYTCGDAELGSGRPPAPTPRAIVAIQAIELEPETTALAVAPWPRNERGVLAGLKTTSYAENVIALAWAQAQGASEVVFGNTVGNLCECSGSNIFLVEEERVITPPLSAGCLAGVTRDLVLAGVEVEERDVPLDHVFANSVTEIFITSTLRMVQGVHRIDNREFASAPGPVTRRIQEYFAALIATKIDP